MAGKKKLLAKDYAVKNKVGSRDSARPVRKIPTKELQEMVTKLKAGIKVRYRRDRSIIERELAGRKDVVAAE